MPGRHVRRDPRDTPHPWLTRFEPPEVHLEPLEPPVVPPIPVSWVDQLRNWLTRNRTETRDPVS